MKYIFSIILAAALFIPTLAQSATYVVNIHDDNASSFSFASADPDENDASINCVVGGGSGNICSLRAAIDIANAAVEDTTIELPTGTITLTQENSSGAETSNESGSLDLNNDGITTTITGNGMSASIIDANGSTLSDRGFFINGAVSAEFDNFTVQSGDAGSGGGVYSAGTLVLDSVKIYNNVANEGGGLFSGLGTVTIVDSVFDSNTTNESCNCRGGAIYFSSSSGALAINRSLFLDNSAEDEGGAIHFFNSSREHTITNSTFFGNQADDGGAISVASSNGSNTYTVELILKHTTFSGNTASGAGPQGGALFIRDAGDDTANIEVYHSIFDNNTENLVEDVSCNTDSATLGTISSLGYNIDSGTSCGFAATGDESSLDLALTSLADNGGETQTMAIPENSAAHNAIDSTTCENVLGSSATDQRVVSRPQGSACDIGAFEIDETSPVVTITSGDDSIECSTDTWTDAGASVTDNLRSSLSYTTSGSVTEETVGSYTITYTSGADYDGNTGTATRTVTVSDNTDPTITVTGESEITLTVGDGYTEQGATASDGCDSSVSVTTSGTVDTNTAGTYTVTYSATDDSNNSASVSRTVIVEEATAEPETEEDPTVNSVTPLTNNQVRVTYSDNTTRTITVFANGSKKPRVQLTNDGERIVAFHQNGKTVRVFNALTGDQLRSKKIRNARQAKTYLKLVQKGGNEYVVAVTKKKKTIRTTLMRLTSESKLNNTNTKRLQYAKRNFSVQIKSKKIRIRKANRKVKQVYKITAGHKLKQI